MSLKPKPIKLLFSILGFLIILVSIPTTVVLVQQAKFPLTKSSAATTWAFEETFDGAPTVPTPFKSPRWDIVIDSNDIDGIMDGQTVAEAVGYATPDAIELGHGPHCEPPYDPTNPNNPNNIHTVPVDFDPLGFQQNTRPLLNFICNNHMMSVAKAGYGISSFLPRQVFDWNGRTGLIEFETSLYPAQGGREWWDLYIAPPQEILLDHVRKDEGGDYEQMPKRALKFKFHGQKFNVNLIDNYQEIWGTSHWQKYGCQTGETTCAFPNDTSINDPRIRRNVRVQVSNTSWKFQLEVDANAPTNAPSLTYETIDGKRYWTFSGNWPQPLSFNQGLIRWGHHSYNATKDGNFGRPWSQFTFHWDNMRFDGPVIPSHTAFEPIAHFVDLRGDPDPNKIRGVKINVNVAASDIKNPRLVGHINSPLTSQSTAEIQTNSIGFQQFRVNGGPWQNVSYIKNIPIDRTWTSFRNTLTNVVAGENTIEFRYPFRPAGATWQGNGYTVKDIEIQIDPVGGGGTPPPPTDTTLPTVSITAPTNGSTVSATTTINATAADNVGVAQVDFLVDGSVVNTDTSSPYSYNWNSSNVVNGAHTLIAKAYDTAGNVGTSTTVNITVSNAISTSGTINFNDRSTGALSGVYPSGLATWNSGWIVSAPFGGFSTPNISFSGASLTSASFTFATPRRVVSIEAGNGGGAVSTITLSCSGNTTKTQSVAAGATVTISTGWTNNCTTVTVGSSNSWETNFDNIVYDTAGGTTTKIGDLNNDNRVDILDLSILLSRFNTSDTDADLNNDGRVDLLDLSTLLSKWGS